MLRFLLTASFVAGLVPAVAFLALYGIRSNWRATGAGRAMLTLMIVITGSYLTSVATLLFPGLFRSEGGTVLRIAVRFAIAIALWRLLLVLARLQKKGYLDGQSGRNTDHR